MRHLKFLVLLMLTGSLFTACKDDDKERDIEITFTSLTPNGSSTETTSVLTLVFSEDIAQLTASDITLDPKETGAQKGELTAKGSGEYQLAVNSITAGGEITVGVTKTGYIIEPESQTATVYFIPGLSGTVTIEGTAKVGETLTAITTGLNATADFSYQWARSNAQDGTYTDIADATNETYTLTDADKDQYIKVTVTSEGYDSAVTSVATEKVAASISWNMVTDSSFGTSTIYKVTYAASKYVAVGYAGKMAYSTDAENWTAVTDSKFGESLILNILYINNKFFAVGANGKMSTSTDAITWTSVTVNFENNINVLSIAYGNNRYVAVGGLGRVSYSDDGETWTKITVTEFDSKTMYRIVYAQNKFIAVGDSGYMFSSTDGITWTKENSGLDTALFSIIYAKNKFIASSVNGKMIASTDGTNWTTVADTKVTTNIRDIVYSAEKDIFVLVGNSSAIAWSADGENWTLSPNSFEADIIGVTYGDGKFVMVGGKGKIAWSATGK